MKDKFSWENFDVDFLKEILYESDYSDEFRERIEDGQDDQYALAGMMTRICTEPDSKFIERYRRVIEHSLFTLEDSRDEVRKIFGVLNIHEDSFNMSFLRLQEKATSRGLVSEYITTLYNLSGIEVPHDPYDRFRFTVLVDPQKTKRSQIELYDFQKKAVSSLTEHYVKNDKERGLLVFPTGAGKTKTAVHFLLREMVPRGYTVLWIAHRHMLIDQAAMSFYESCNLVNDLDPDMNEFKISCISGEHLRCSAVPKGNHVIVATIQSLFRNLERLKVILTPEGKKEKPKLIVVVDESHHTYAKTYRKTISHLKKLSGKFKLLGLTATPVRANEEDSHRLRTIFDNCIISSESMSNLITRQILAKPVCYPVPTNTAFEQDFTPREKRDIRQYGELPESVLSKIAISKKRNGVIVQKYMDMKAEFGKTLIFALNKVHCVTLTDELKQRGIKCNCVYAGKADNDQIISDYKNGKYDVLVNVNIMTEGSDVPDIQTVFLTRPTQSESFLLQMIGRGMRGIQAGGTETVNVVDFHDKWNIFTEWMNAEYLLEIELLGPEKEKIRHQKKYTEYEWKTVLEVYRKLKEEYQEIGEFTIFPYGWYSLKDENGEAYHIIVFEDQIRGYQRMLNEKNAAVWVDDPEFSAEKAIYSYFDYFCNGPSEHDIDVLMDYFRESGEIPSFYTFDEQLLITPKYVVDRIDKNGDATLAFLKESAKKIYDENPVAKDIYGDLSNYQLAICRTYLYKNDPNKIGAIVEELPIERIPFDRTPCYDLEELANEVNDEMFDGKYGFMNIIWTGTYEKNYFGLYDKKNHLIKINKILNSVSVPREVTKFIIYHEMLHRDNMKHDEAFRREEHKYKNWQELDHFLDSKMNDFDIREW